MVVLWHPVGVADGKLSPTQGAGLKIKPGLGKRGTGVGALAPGLWWRPPCLVGRPR